MSGGQQQQAGLLAGGDWRDEQADGAGRVMQRDRSSSSPDRGPGQPTVTSPQEESFTRGQ